MKTNFEIVNLNYSEYPLLFVDYRIDRALIPASIFAYDVRHADDDSLIFSTIEPHVVVNFAGTILSLVPLFDGEFLSIDDWNFTGETTCIDKIHDLHEEFVSKKFTYGDLSLSRGDLKHYVQDRKINIWAVTDDEMEAVVEQAHHECLDSYYREIDEGETPPSCWMPDDIYDAIIDNISCIE